MNYTSLLTHNCICTLVPVHEEPEEFVARLKRWTENPESEPGLEQWYNDIYLEKASEKNKRLVQALRETEACSSSGKRRRQSCLMMMGPYFLKRKVTRTALLSQSMSYDFLKTRY